MVNSVRNQAQLPQTFQTFGEKVGFEIGNGVHVLTELASSIFVKAQPLFIRLGSSSLQALSTLKNASIRLVGSSFNKLAATSVGVKVMNKAKQWKLDVAARRVSNIVVKLFGFAKTTAIKFLVAVDYAGYKALEILKKYKTPVFEALKKNTVRAASFTYNKVMKPSAIRVSALVSRLLSPVTKKCAPVVKTLNKYTFAPLNRYVIQPTYHLTKDVLSGVQEGYVNPRSQVLPLLDESDDF